MIFKFGFLVFRQKVIFLQLLFSLCFCFLTISLLAQNKGIFLTKKAISEDMTKVTESFDRIAPMPYLWVDSVSIRLKRDSLLFNLPDSVSIKEGRKTLAKFISSYGLGHSQMNFWGLYLDSLRHFPFQVNIEDERLFLVKNYSSDTTAAQGMEITSINGISTSHLIPELVDCMSLERKETKEYYLASMFDYMLRYYYDWHDPRFRMTLLSKKGDSITGDFSKAKSQKNEQIQASPTTDFFAFQFLNDSIAQIRINRFHSFKTKVYREAIKTSFKKIDEKGAKILIIDIRGNGGGSSRHLRELAAYLTSKEISFEGKSIRKTTAESKKFFRSYFFNWYTYPLYPLIYLFPQTNGLFYGKNGKLTISEDKTEKLKKVIHPFEGRVFLLVDRGTYSTSSMLTSCFQCHGIAKIVGIGSGEPTVGDGDPVEITLQNTGARFSIGTAVWFNPCYEKADKNKMLFPDIPSEQGKEYEALLEYLKQNY